MRAVRTLQLVARHQAGLDAPAAGYLPAGVQAAADSAHVAKEETTGPAPRTLRR